MGSIPTRSRHPLRRCTGPPSRTVLLLLLSLGLGWAAVPRALSAQEADPPPADTTASAAGDTVPSGPPVTPLGAFARSVVVPGWGQAEVDQPTRGAVYFVAEAATLFMALRAQLRLNAARRGLPADSGLVAARKEQRENWFALAVFWSLLSGVDAWVSTHFWDFEGKLRPPEDGSAGIEFRYRVPLGGG